MLQDTKHLNPEAPEAPRGSSKHPRGPDTAPLLTVEVVDQLGVRLSAGSPGHRPGEEQSHECQRGAGQQVAHPTDTCQGKGDGISDGHAQTRAFFGLKTK